MKVRITDRLMDRVSDALDSLPGKYVKISDVESYAGISRRKLFAVLRKMEEKYSAIEVDWQARTVVKQ